MTIAGAAPRLVEYVVEPTTSTRTASPAPATLVPLHKDVRIVDRAGWPGYLCRFNDPQRGNRSEYREARPFSFTCGFRRQRLGPPVYREAQRSRQQRTPGHERRAGHPNTPIRRLSSLTEG